MKFIFPILSLVILLLSLSSCKDDFNINGDAEESAVVYALLDPNDQTHFVKVTKAFVTSDSNLETAQIADSSYFNSVQGVVAEYKNGVATGRSWNLTDTLIENKESGVFYYPFQKMYMFKTLKEEPLIAEKGYTYQLKLDINNGEFEVFGETEIVRDVKINSFQGTTTIKFANPFTNPDRYLTSRIKINRGTGYIYDLRMEVFYSEFTSSTDSTIKSFIWKLGSASVSQDQSNNSDINIDANGETFYKLMAQNIHNNPNVIKRNLKKIDIILTSGSQVLNSYIDINKPSSNITQNKITYTNLEASNGRKVLGIFTSRTTVVLTKEENKMLPGNNQQLSAINEHSMRELCKGQYTGLLNFCSPSTVYQSKDFYCN